MNQFTAPFRGGPRPLSGGSETDPIFTDCAEAPQAVLPHSTLLRPPGLNHDSAQTYGKSETIAAALRLFFGQRMT